MSSTYSRIVPQKARWGGGEGGGRAGLGQSERVIKQENRRKCKQFGDFGKRYPGLLVLFCQLFRECKGIF